jgi:hypothetical protein
VAWTTDRPIGRTPSRLSRPQVNFRRWPPPRTHDDARFLLADQPITTPPAGNATVASITSPSAIVSRSPSALRVAFHQRQAVCVPTPPAASHNHARIRSLVPQHHAPVSRAVSGEPAFAIMLRPATPLSILFFAAFVLLLLSTLSTPVIKSFPLATFNGVNFGILGYCDGNKCVGPKIGYDTGMSLAAGADFS